MMATVLLSIMVVTVALVISGSDDGMLLSIMAVVLLRCRIKVSVGNGGGGDGGH